MPGEFHTWTWHRRSFGVQYSGWMPAGMVEASGHAGRVRQKRVVFTCCQAQPARSTVLLYCVLYLTSQVENGREDGMNRAHQHSLIMERQMIFGCPPVSGEKPHRMEKKKGHGGAATNNRKHPFVVVVLFLQRDLQRKQRTPCKGRGKKRMALLWSFQCATRAM